MCASTSVVSAPGHQRCSLHDSGNSLSPTRLLSGCMSLVFVILKFNRANLKCTVYGRKQARKQANIHTHVRNAVPLVLGLVRLAPITCLLSLALLLVLLCTHNNTDDKR